MKGTEDKMEVDGTKFSIWLLYSHPRRTRGIELRLKRQSVFIWMLPTGSEVWPLRPKALYSVLSTTPNDTSEKVGRREEIQAARRSKSTGLSKQLYLTCEAPCPCP